MTQNALVRHQDGFYEITPKPSPEALAAFYRDKYYGARDGRSQYAHGYTDEELEHKRISAAEIARMADRAP